jgi:hypothetical protein
VKCAHRSKSFLSPIKESKIFGIKSAVCLLRLKLTFSSDSYRVLNAASVVVTLGSGVFPDVIIQPSLMVNMTLPVFM